jgi:hypothetical protein
MNVRLSKRFPRTIYVPGEKSKLESARNKITAALIGLIIVASAWAVWTIVLKFMGLDTAKLPFPVLGQ